MEKHADDLLSLNLHSNLDQESTGSLTKLEELKWQIKDYKWNIHFFEMMAAVSNEPL